MSKEKSKFSSFLTAKKDAVEREAPPATALETEAKPQSTRPKKPKVKELPVLLHFPEDLLGRIDTIVGALPLNTSRRAWIMNRLFQAVIDEEKKVFNK